MAKNKLISSRSFRYVIIALVLIILAGVVLGWAQWDDFQPWAKDVAASFWEAMESIHPVLFYVILGLAPTLAVPISPFFIIAPGLHGIWVAIPASALALFVALSVAYWLARSVFRGLAVKIIEKKGMEIPTVRREEQVKFILFLRITPGIPFVVQNMILGAAKIPFWRYMMVSFPFQYAWALAFMLLGDSIIRGSKGAIILAIGFFVGVFFGTMLIKGRMKGMMEESTDENEKEHDENGEEERITQ